MPVSVLLETLDDWSLTVAQLPGPIARQLEADVRRVRYEMHEMGAVFDDRASEAEAEKVEQFRERARLMIAGGRIIGPSIADMLDVPPDAPVKTVEDGVEVGVWLYLLITRKADA